MWEILRAPPPVDSSSAGFLMRRHVRAARTYLERHVARGADLGIPGQARRD
jgi:hypothetical protein